MNADYNDYDDENIENKDDADIRLVEKIFSPIGDELIDVSVIPRSNIIRVSTSLALKEALNINRHQFDIFPNGEKRLRRYVTLDEIAMQKYLHATRSADGKLLEFAVMLADSQELENLGIDSTNDLFRGT